MSVLRIDSFKTVAFGGISGAFVPLGTPLAHNWRAFRITNATEGDMIFSLDGINNNLFVPARTFVLYDISTNSSVANNQDTLIFSIGTQFYVKQSTPPVSGAVYLEGIYAKGE